MSDRSIDREVLMLFLAHQNGFVTDEQMVKALDVWTSKDKEEPLGIEGYGNHGIIADSNFSDFQMLG